MRDAWRQNMDETRRKIHEEKERKQKDERDAAQKLSDDMKNDVI